MYGNKESDRFILCGGVFEGHEQRHVLSCVQSIRSLLSNYYFLLIESFSHQRLRMIFHWSLRDNKSPQVSRTLLSIQANLSNALVWIVSTRSLISKSSSPFTKPLVTVPRAPITIGITVTFMFHRHLSFLSAFFKLYSLVGRDTKVRSSGQVLVIHIYHKIPEKFVYHILQYRFWVVRILFFVWSNLNFLHNSPVDHLLHTVVSSLILFLCEFAVLAYYVIDCFVSITK